MFDFTLPIYIQFYENRIKITRPDTQEVVEQIAEESFTSVRLLLGDFENGEKCLKLALIKLKFRKWLSPQLSAIVHAMSKTEGGLSAIEIRSFKEVIERCGAKKIIIYQNENTLGIHEALKALKSVT
jgi:hypothetical protein